MKFKNPLIVVKDIDASVKFYRQVLGLRVTCDFGANKTLTGGLSLQTLDTWTGFIGVSEQDVVFGNNSSEIYFETDDFDAFANKLKTLEVKCVHDVKEFPWGQRGVRIYDPDGHIIEIGENMRFVFKRFRDHGMTDEEIAERADVSLSYVKANLH